MTICPILAVGFAMKAVAVLWFLTAIAMILIILVQKGRGGGLSGAFGGGGMASSVLGTKTGDFLTWATICLVGIFFILLVLMARFYRPSIGEYGQPTAPVEQQAPMSEPVAGADAPATQMPQQGADQESMPQPVAPEGSVDVNGKG